MIKYLGKSILRKEGFIIPHSPWIEFIIVRKTLMGTPERWSSCIYIYETEKD